MGQPSTGAARGDRPIAGGPSARSSTLASFARECDAAGSVTAPPPRDASRFRIRSVLTSRLALVSLLCGFAPSLSFAQAPERKIAEMELLLLGVTATVEPANPVIPKNTDAGVRIVVKAGGQELSLSDAIAFFGPLFWVEGELSGSGLDETKTLSSRGTGPELSADPLLLPIPALARSGDYELNNLRVMAGGRPVLEVQPRHVPVKVIEQVLVTSVTTRPLTLDEIRAKGIVLDSDDYYAFEFTLGLKLESKPVTLTFPVAFDRQGVPVPQYITPPAPPTREGLPLPTIIPILFEVDQGPDGPAGSERLPPMPSGGGEIRIPSVIIIPGNVGFLMQFFSAKLFVANGAPVGSGLSVRGITGTIALPLGPDQVKGLNPKTGKNDDPLALPMLLRDGQEIPQPETMPVRGVGPDGEPGTADDIDTLAPAEQGEAEFLILGKAEGFHTIDFDIRAVLDGLVTGPVKIKGKASGAVLVRNPYFDVSFTVPGIVRTGETFKVFVTLTNLSESSAANNVTVTLPEGSTSGAKFVGTLPPVIPTIGPGESKTFDLQYLSQRTGQVVASYLRFDTEGGQQQPTGSLHLSVGIGERGVPLSPDTLVLPTAVDELPATVVEAAMRVLGQAWSVANAPGGTLPKGIVRTNRNVVTQKALALAEAGLRISLGQKRLDALRDVAFDFWGGQPLDPGFDQLLRTTDAGSQLRRAIGVALAGDPDFGSPLGLETALAYVAASGPDFGSFAVAGGDAADPLEITLLDAAGRKTSTLGTGPDGPPSEVPSATLLPLGTAANAPVLGIVAAATGGAYTLELRSPVDTVADVSMTLPRGDGTFVRGAFYGVEFQPGLVVRVAYDPRWPDDITLAKEGAGSSARHDGRVVEPQGPRVVSATLIGPETLQGASPFGFQLVALFDRVVDGESAARKENYAIPKNAVHGAKRQLSGRLVFASLDEPEGGPDYVPTTFSVVGGVSDPRGNEGPAGTVGVGSRLEDPGAVVSGRVFQADGTPVSSGVVTYVNNSDTTCYRPNETGFAAVALDSEGHYEFRYVRQDNCGQPFKIVTQDPATGGRRQASAFVRAAREAITLDLALFGRGGVEGTVRAVNGTPVPGASVVAVSQTDPQIGGAATTDGVGHYLIDGITVGPIVVKAAKGTGLGSQPGRIDRAGAVATVDLVLDGQAAQVSGTVYKVEDGEQTPVPGIYVYFEHNDQILAATPAAADGSFEFDGVPAGQFTVWAALNSRDRDSKQGVAVAGISVSRDLLIVIPKLAELATVSGQVFLPDGQTPAGDVVVSVAGRGVASADGSFTIAGVAVRGDAQTVLAQTRDGRRSGSTTVLANEPKAYGGLRIVLSGLGTAAFRVLDETGKPVKGQKVDLLTRCSDPCGCASATADADGIASFGNISYGTLTAQAVRSTATFTDVARGSLSIQADGTTVLTTMSFAGAGVVEGTVRDSLGNPVHGADVALSSNHMVMDGFSACGLQYGQSAATRTGLDGRFRFAGVNLGPVAVSAKQAFFGSGAIGNKGTLVSPGQTLTLDMAFADTTAGVLSGDVLLPGGEPAGAGIEVAVEGPLPEVVVPTDADGHYEFPHILPEGYYKLTAIDRVGGGLARLNVALKRQQDLSQDVQLKGRGTVRVQVVAGDDEPLESALVKLTETEYPSRTLDQSVRPGNQGRVVFLDVYEGPLRIDVSDPFARSGSATAVLGAPGEEIDVKVEVTPTGRVTGHFRMPDLAPVPYGTVTLKAGGRVVGQTTALGQGNVGFFSFDYVPVGPVSLEAQDPLTARKGSKTGTLDHEGDPPLELEVIAQGLGRVFGTVTLGGGAQALAHVGISSGSYHATALTDGSGRYDVSGVPEGRVTVTASLTENGFLAGSASDVLEGDGGSVEIDVALRDAGSVQGRIVPASVEDRAAGRFPAADVRLFVGGTGGGAQETSTRPDGTFSFDVVPTGRVTFTADVADTIDGGSATVDIVAGQNEVTIPLQGVGTLEGTAVASDEAGAPPVDGWITFSGTAFPGGASIRVGNDGTFRFPEVLAGDFTARLQHGQGALALYGSVSGSVAAGQEQSVRIALQPSGEIRGSVFRPAATPEGKRPAFGAEVQVVLAKGGTIPLLAQEDGTFSLKGVPLGAFSVRVFDPISEGRASLSGGSLEAADRCGTEPGTCHDLGEVLIDDQAPALSFVEPAPGTARRPFGGTIVVKAEDPDVDPSSFTVRLPNGSLAHAQSFSFSEGTFYGSLPATAALLGSNRLVASVKDLSGNLGQADVQFTVQGGTVRGVVLDSEEQPVGAGVPVRLNSFDLVTAPDGSYRKDGLAAGLYTATATDPATQLKSSPVSDNLADGGDLLLPPLHLPEAGSIAGVVYRAGTTTGAAGVTVTVDDRPYETGSDGSFATAPLTTGIHVVEAAAANGDRGRVSVFVTRGAPTPAAVVLEGVGKVTVVVTDSSGQAVAGAQVKVTTTSAFGSPAPTTTPGSGLVEVLPVFAGTISAVASKGLLVSGPVPAQLLHDGTEVIFNLALEPVAHVSGTIRRWNDAPVVGATVTLELTGRPALLTETTGGGGAFAFPQDVPLGAARLGAQAPDGDREFVDLTLVAPQPPIDLRLAGTGAVRVTVKDSLGQAALGATVSVEQIRFGLTHNGATDAAGIVSLAGILAGDLRVTVGWQGLGGQRQVHLDPGLPEPLPVEIQLSNAGTIAGVVLAPPPGGPVEGAEIRLGLYTGSSFTPRYTTTGTGGAFAFPDVPPTQSYVVEVRTVPGGWIRARATGITVTEGQTRNVTLTLVGVGVVQGRVTEAGQPSAGARVDLQVPGAYGGTRTTTTGTDGLYQFADVPVDATQQFTVTASIASRGLNADLKDRVQFDGQVVTANLALLANTVSVPTALTDRNQESWTIQPSGAVSHWGLSYDAPDFASRLELRQGGVTRTFVGRGQSGAEATEEAKREIVLRQADLFGLEVTRKVYVPAEGYFVRFLEILRNPGDAPVTLEVALASTVSRYWSDYYGAGAPAVLPLPSPRYLVFDDTDTADYYSGEYGANYQLPPVAIAFAGTEAQAPQASLDASSSTLRYAWGGLTVLPHRTLALLHMWSLQPDRGRAEASGDRLAGLPPEVLTGLSPEEATAILNFSVPGDLRSALPPLPPNDGVVEGRVLAGDGQTPLSNQYVRFRSRSAHFGRSIGSSTDSSGSFQIQAFNNRALPRMAFDLTSSRDMLGTQTAVASGDFARSGVRDLTAIDGLVLQASSSWPGYGVDKAFDGDPATAWYANQSEAFGSGGTPSLTALLPGPATVHRVLVKNPRPLDGQNQLWRARIELLGPGEEVLWASGTVDLSVPERDLDVTLPEPVPGVMELRLVGLVGIGVAAVGEVQAYGEGDLGPSRRAHADVVFAGTGILDVRVVRADASPLVGASVSLESDTRTSGLSTDSAGSVRYFTVPPGVYAVAATQGGGGLTVRQSGVPVSAGAAGPPVVLRFPAFGTVGGYVVTHGGSRQPGSSVRLTGPGFSRSTTSDSVDVGRFSFSDVPPGGPYSIEATDSSRSQGTTTTAEFLVAAGANERPDVRLPPVGALRVVARVGGQPHAGAVVEWRSESRASGWITASGKTDANGELLVTRVPGVAIDVLVHNQRLPSVTGTASGELEREAQELVVPVDVPPVSVVTGVVRSRAGVPRPSISVGVVAVDTGTYISSTNSGADGSFTLVAAEGTYRLRTAEVIWAGGYTYSMGAVSLTVPPGGDDVNLDALVPRGILAQAGQRDVWQLDLVPGPVLQFGVQGAAEGSAPKASSLVFDVFGPDGAPLLSGYDWANLTPTQAGRYAVVVRAGNGTATGGYRLYTNGGDNRAAFWSWNGGGVTGTVRFGGVPAANALVRLTSTASPFSETRTAGDGRFLIPVWTPQTVTAEVVDAEGVVIARRSAQSGDELVDVALEAPGRVPVTVRVTRGGLPSRESVLVESDNVEALAEDGRRERTTSVQGELSTILPVGRIRASVTSGGATYSDEGDGLGAPLLLEIDAPAEAAALHGTVRGGDDGTPVPGATVEIVGFGSTVTGPDGSYRFEAVPPATYPVRASLGAISIQSILSIGGGDVPFDPVLPLSILRGRVAEPDDSGVVAALSACGYTAGGSWVCVNGVSDPSGSYVFYQLPAWRTGSVYVSATPNDGSRASAGRWVSYVAGTPRTYVVPLTLPVTAGVAGTVRGGAGPYQVSLLTSSGYAVHDPIATVDGSFELRHVDPSYSPVTVRAEDVHGIPGQATAELTGGQTTMVEVSLVPTGTLTVSLQEEGAPRAGRVEVIVPLGPFDTRWSRTVDLPDPSSGESPASFPVPAGPFWVLYDDGSSPAAAAEGELAVDGEASVVLEAGSHVRLPYVLTGDDGAYAVPSYGWGSDGSADAPFVPVTSVSGTAQPSAYGDTLARLNAVERRLDTPVDVAEGLRAWRRYSVAASGEFSRTVTLVQDREGVDRDVTIQTESSARGESGEASIIGTSDGDQELETGDTWVVARLPSGAATVFVFGSAVTGASFQTWGGCGEVCSWPGAQVSQVVHVPAGKSRLLVTYFAQGSWSDEEAIARAEGLASLTTADALAGLTPEEMQAIVNFTLPSFGAVAGTVHREDGATGVAGAAVALARDGRVQLRATANDDGAFRFDGVPEGDVVVEAWDPVSYQAGRTAVTVVADSETPADVRLLDGSQQGAVDVRVEREDDGSPVPGMGVRLRADGWVGWSPTTVTGAGGHATFPDVPTGPVVVSLPSLGVAGQSITVLPGETRSVLFRVSPLVNLPFDLTGADRVPYFMAGDAGLSGPSGECRPLCNPGGSVYGGAWSVEYPTQAQALLLFGREVQHGPHEGGPVRVTRRIFVPASGRFARVLNTVENVSGDIVPYQVLQEFQLRAYGGGAWSVTETSSGDLSFDGMDDYAVFTAPGEREVAIVAAGPGAARPSAWAWEDGSSLWGGLTFDGTLAPAQRQTWMTFYVVRSNGGSGGPASALASLQDPEALQGLAPEDVAALANFLPPLIGRGGVAGRVTLRNGTGVVDATVGLVDGGGALVAASKSRTDGSFGFYGVLPGDYVLVAVDPGSGRAGRTPVTVVGAVVVPADVQILDEDELGRLAVHAAWLGSSDPVSDVTLSVSAQGFGGVWTGRVTLDAAGEAGLEGVPPGPVTVTWPAPYRVAAGTGDVVSGQATEVSFQVPPFGTVGGSVRAADGQTGVPWAIVEVRDVDSGDPLATTWADENGGYSFADVYPGAGGFRVVATWEDDPGITASTVGAFASPGESLPRDVTLPLAVIRGTVTFAGGAEPVPEPQVFVEQAGVPDPRAFYAIASGADGRYAVLVPGPGDYLVTAQDSPTGLTGTAPATVTDVASGAVVPVSLAPSGRVVVTVLDHEGHAVTGAEVGLASIAAGVDRLATTDGTGAATFERVPLGSFRVQARDADGIRGAVNGYVDPGGSLPVTVTLPETVGLEGEVLDSPTGWAEIDVRTLDNEGVFGPFRVSTYAEPGYSVAVPKGRVRVRASTRTDETVLVGSAEGVADGSATVNAGLGNAAFAKARLEGADGVRWDVNCDGAVGGPVDGSDGDPAYDYGAYFLAVARRDVFAGDCGAMPFDENGRELAVGPVNQAGVEVTRKVYVPEAGGFARFLAILTNTTDYPVTVPVEVGGGLASQDQTRLVVGPNSTGRTYAVTDSGDQCCHPALGFVMAGAGALVGTDRIDGFSDGSWGFGYRWTVTLSPAQTAVLMHFAVQRPNGDAEGARQQAEALAGLTDPAALEQMTPEERSRVVNFDVP
jgi:hypothetical protein